MQHNEDFQHLCADAKQRVAEVSADNVVELIATDKCPVLIDVRETAEFTKSHLPNAFHLSRGIIEIHIHKFAKKDTPVILYCGGGHRSLLAGDNLLKMGYTSVTSMAGGFREWAQKGYPVLDTNDA